MHLNPEHPTQVLSFSFDDAGKCYKFTGGEVVDRTTGDCSGLGGVFGIVWGLGGRLPFPEGRPWSPSMRWRALAYHLPQILRDWRAMGGVDVGEGDGSGGRKVA